MATAPAAKKKPMGMGSVRPQMQGPISGGAGGGMRRPGPRGGGNFMPPSRGPMPLPPSAAQRPAQLPAPPMMPGGGSFSRPMAPGGGFVPPGQPPAGGPQMPPPMMDGGWGGPAAPLPNRGFLPNERGVPMRPGMGSIGPPPLANSPAPGLPPGKQMPDMQALLAQIGQRRQQF